MKAKKVVAAVVLGNALTIALVVALLWTGAVGASPVNTASSSPGVPALISYQGRLTDPSTGQPMPDGNCNMVFRIYDAETEGRLLWTGLHTQQTETPVPVAKGLFNVVLGSGGGDTLTPGVFGRGPAWLEVEVEGETLTPRQQIGSVAYALWAQHAVVAEMAAQAQDAETLDGLHAADLDDLYLNADGPNQMSGATSGLLLSVDNTGTGSAVSGRSSGGPGVVGSSDSTYGVQGLSLSTEGKGVYGRASTETGTTYGVFGRSQSSSGRGVHGEAPAYGVEGYALSQTGRTFGVNGIAYSADGTGAKGSGRALIRE